MKKGVGYLLNSLLISLLPWPALWLVSFFYLGGNAPEVSKNFTLTWLLSSLASFLIVLAILTFNLARLLERWGYSRKDIVRLPEILDENFGNVNLLKSVRESIHYHFSFWGVYATVSLVYGPVKSALFVTSLVAGVVLFSPVMLPVFIFVVGIPAFLYFTSKGEADRVRGLFEWVIEVSMASLVLLLFLRLLALHCAIPNEYLDVSELRNLLRLAGDPTVFEGLFILSSLGVVSGIAGYLSARHSKLSLLALLVVGIVSVFVDLRLLQLLV